MKIEDRTFRIIGEPKTVFVRDHEEKVTMFRPEWQSIDNPPYKLSVNIGSRVLETMESDYEQQFMAQRWHRKASAALAKICTEELGLNPTQFEYTPLNGYEFVFLFRSQFEALRFKMMVGE